MYLMFCSLEELLEPSTTMPVSQKSRQPFHYDTFTLYTIILLVWRKRDLSVEAKKGMFEGIEVGTNCFVWLRGMGSKYKVKKKDRGARN